MAGLADFLMPIAQPQVPDPAQLRGAWDQYLNDPATQAALLSFGAQAAQPRQWGQSDFGHLMSSVSQGGAGVRQVDEQGRKERELGIKEQDADSKQVLREAQAGQAEARAAVAGANANNAEGRLQMRQAELDARVNNNRFSRILQANRLYQTELTRLGKINENNALMRRPLVPMPGSMDEWLRGNPAVMASLGIATPEELHMPAPGGAGTPATGAPAPGGPPAPTSGAPAAPQTPPQPGPPPPPAASRPDGYIHDDPIRGRLRWDARQKRWFAAPAGQ